MQLKKKTKTQEQLMQLQQYKTFFMATFPVTNL